jgi:hypothetical protein
VRRLAADLGFDDEMDNMKYKFYNIITYENIKGERVTQWSKPVEF